MKFWAIVGFLVLSVSSVYGQTTVLDHTTVFAKTTPTSITVGPQWTVVAHTPSDHPCSNTNTCTITIPSTGTGHALIIGVGNFNPNNDMTFSSITGGGGTWTNCTNCHLYQNNQANNIFYNLSPSSGVTSLTVNLTSANNTSVTWNIDVAEVAWSGGSVFFDVGGRATTTCSGFNCLGVSLTLSGADDFIFQQAFPANSITAISGGAGYTAFQDFLGGSGAGYAGAANTSDGTVPTWTDSNSGDLVGMAAIALSSSGGGGGGTGSWVKSCENYTASSSTPTCVFTGNGTIGNTLMFMVTARTSATSTNSVTSSCITGNATIAASLGSSGLAIGYAPITSAVSCTLTAHLGGTAGDIDFIGREVTGVSGIDPNVSAVSLVTSSSSTPSTTVTVTDANDYMFCGGSDLNFSAGTLTVGTGYTQRETLTPGGFHAIGQDQIFSSTGSLPCGFNSTTNNVFGVGAMAFH